MADVVTDALLATLPGSSVRGIYYKGSAVKPWDSPIDYVPEVSDVDLHVWFLDEASATGSAAMVDIDGGLRRHELVEQAWHERRPTPAHVPRVQVVVMNEFARDASYVPSPAASVRKLHGEPYPQHPFDVERVRRDDAGALLDPGHEAAIRKVAFDLVETPAHHVRKLVRMVSWRVSPIASRVRSILGDDYDAAWGECRTAAVLRLVELDQPDVARHLVDYYSACWRLHLSAWTDGAAARTALAAAAAALRASADVARSLA